MKKLALIIPLALLLSSCAATLDERIGKRETCHKAGGTYTEWEALVGIRGYCDLSDK